MKNLVRLLMLFAAYGTSVAVSYAHSATIVPNHPFDHVEIAYSHNDCSFMYSPVDFCDERHASIIKNAIATGEANFDRHYILLKIREWRPSEYYGDSVVVIDAQTGVVYPMPFDYYSGKINMKNSKIARKSKLNFSANSNVVCIDGSILVYRATSNGYFCFYFDGKAFSGYHTEYMN